jgi:hypothetical protein
MKNTVREIEAQIAQIERELARQNAEFAEALNDFATDAELKKLRPLTQRRGSALKPSVLLATGFVRV